MSAWFNELAWRTQCLDTVQEKCHLLVRKRCGIKQYVSFQFDRAILLSFENGMAGIFWD